MIAGIVLFGVGLVITVGLPMSDSGLAGFSDDDDDDSTGDPQRATEDDSAMSDSDEPSTGDEGNTADSGEEAPANGTDSGDGNGENEQDGSTDTSTDGEQDEQADSDESENSQQETNDTEEDDDSERYTYSITVKVADADTGEPVENEPVQLYPVNSDPEQYLTDENGEVTIRFDHSNPDDVFEYILAVGEGERVIEIEAGEQTEYIPLSSEPTNPDGEDG